MARRHPVLKLYHHPFVVRLTHWLNAIALTVMVLSGLRIYWGYEGFNLSTAIDPKQTYTAPAVIDFSDGMRLRLSEVTSGTLVPVRFPRGFYDRVTLGGWLAGGLRWHFTFMWLYVITGLLYLSYSIVGGNYRTVIFRPRDVRGVWPMLAYYLRVRRTRPPYDKYNPLQRLAYTVIVLAGIFSVLTGLAVYKPVQLDWLSRLFGGYQYTRLWHFLLVWVFVGFVVVHLIMVILAGWANFVSMITGWKPSHAPVSVPTMASAGATTMSTGHADVAPDFLTPDTTSPTPKKESPHDPRP